MKNVFETSSVINLNLMNFKAQFLGKFYYEFESFVYYEKARKMFCRDLSHSLSFFIPTNQASLFEISSKLELNKLKTKSHKISNRSTRIFD